VEFKSRLVPGVLIGGLVLAGGGSVIAASGGSSSVHSSAQNQYCPPNSPNGGQPQGGPGNNCGNPPETCPDGSPKPPPGNCGKNNPPGQGEKPPKDPKTKKPKAKKPKFRVHKHPRQGCVSRTFVARISISNKPKGRRVTVLRDGRKIKSTKSRAFKVRFDVSGLSRGAHVIKLKVRGADGKVATRTVRFNRC
jgi:hypothetical protein